MGILNLTPDSFYQGSRIQSTTQAVDTAGQMIEAGADILDLGAMSTRPGAPEIDATDETNRLAPSLEAVRKAFPDAFISVDTYRAKIAHQAVRNGADMINDISGGEFDEEMFDTLAALKVPYVLMHTGGKPSSMQINPTYEEVVSDIAAFFNKNLTRLKSLGVSQVILDPGFGFGKTIEHNYRLLAGLQHFRQFQHPVMVGLSRKSMINKVLNINPEDALNGTSVLHTIALLNGADILRVHDVQAAVECKRLVHTYREMGFAARDKEGS